ncbi:phosphotransferase enzyme family protein [Paenibacillus sp. FSL R7-0026]|uniref:phosphotransferase enzyme family protein n=1 Tax=Paenibacillus sp. FSL R7-0026 TaxID=2921668 RepID=UPI0030F506F9
MVGNEILSQAADSFGFDTNTLKFVSNSCNEVYRFNKGHKEYFLRLSEKPVEFELNIKAEVHWVRYLVERGIHASLPIQTIEGELTAVCKHYEKCYIATAFEGASGIFFDNDPQLWGQSLFKTWGETMGSMHRLTKSYDPGDLKNKRMEWNVAEINNPHLHFGNYQILLNKLRTIEKEMKNLPRSKESYGLIHYDFHPYNFLIDQGKITVFDFDDSLYGWFALDIGIAATHAVWWGSDYKAWGSKHEFAKHFLNEFLEGYIKQNSMGQEWIQRIPLFMEYRNISSFFWWLNNWNGKEENLTDFQKNAIIETVKLIESDKPLDGCDIKL